MTDPALDVSDLVVRRGDRRILDGTSIRADAGEVVGLVGPNGAGKTTLLRACTGAVGTESGGVRLTGDPIERKRRPENFVDCQFSMPFGAAIALERGDAGLAAFRAAQGGLDDPDLRRLMDLTDVVTTDAVADLFPEQWAARVVVETGDDRFERFVEVARGEPEKPLDWGAIGAKFDELATAADVPGHVGDAMKTAVRGLGETTDLDDLLEALRDATAPEPARADD